ncbi:MAG: 2-oxoacid:acceptor oxidoreductase subunit alpha [Gemmatimonadota bacterium]|nr:MAG: 2-oxoacid:acceptor oxidoreductase subunit alpha [Gemmatimonadota bacterium]
MRDRFTSSSPDLRGVKAREVRDSVVIRFAGDSGDGMQFTGSQFTLEAALAGSDIATFPDYPAEIRAPAGSTYGVSAFQIHFGGGDLTTAGDAPDVLVALNPAALKVSYQDLRIGGLIVVDTGAFTKRNLGKAGYETSPLDDDTLAPYQVLKLDITQRTLDALEGLGLKQKDALRSRNLWTLGLMLWMFGQDRSATAEWVERKFAKQPEIARANVAALNAGHAFGETVEMPMDVVGYTVAKADVPPGIYRTVTGTEATAWGLLAGTQAAGLPQLFFGSYPITPATSLLHVLAGLKSQGVLTFQAEDEIAAICASIGASYSGVLGVTSSSGPGIALKGEAMGLAVAVELPLVIVNSQRAGPSTGMPTKAEQADLYQAVYGRNGDAPLPVLAAATPADCFDVALEAVRLATKYMTPVVMLTDGYLANAAEPWLVPDADELPRFPVQFRSEPEGFQPFRRDPHTLARPWAIPGTPGLEHRIGGLERDAESGHISYDPDNHQRMTDARLAKVRRIADDIPEQEIQVGTPGGALAVVGWGSTYGPIYQAVRRAREEGLEVSHLHLRHLNPLPRNLGDLLRSFEQIMVPEMNTGQLVTILRSTYLVAAEGVSKVTGKPFKVSEILDAIRTRLER